MASEPPSSPPPPELVGERRNRYGGEGDVAVFVADEQADEPVDLERWRRLAEAVLADEGVRGHVEMSLLFVDEEAIGLLNQRFLDETGPTDVLAFPIEDDLHPTIGRHPDGGSTGPDTDREEREATMPMLLGDVVICPEVAVRNAPDHAGDPTDEVALLVVHGVLHLLGMDHGDDEETAAMQAREAELLVAHHRPLAIRPLRPAPTAEPQPGDRGR